MIPTAYITEWRAHAPWLQSAWVEQDLVISRALVAIFGNEDLAQRLAFRGGTALAKLYLTPAARYSEDIDLVQAQSAHESEARVNAAAQHELCIAARDPNLSNSRG